MNFVHGLMSAISGISAPAHNTQNTQNSSDENKKGNFADIADIAQVRLQEGKAVPPVEPLAPQPKGTNKKPKVPAVSEEVIISVGEPIDATVPTDCLNDVLACFDPALLERLSEDILIVGKLEILGLTLRRISDGQLMLKGLEKLSPEKKEAALYLAKKHTADILENLLKRDKVQIMQIRCNYGRVHCSKCPECPSFHRCKAVRRLLRKLEDKRYYDVPEYNFLRKAIRGY